VSAGPLLAIEDLTVVASARRRRDAPVRILSRVSLELAEGEALGIVGESGSGKSTLALATLGLLAAGLSVHGRIRFTGRDLVGLGEREFRALRGAQLAAVFQNPFRSLNPSMRIDKQIAEALALDGVRGAAARTEIRDLLARVGLADPERVAVAHPHTLSGGMQQRVAIALAIARRPRLLVADEPTTALDVRVQAQILELLGRLCREGGMALILISHDLGVVSSLADQVAVMYSGRLVESGPSRALFATPNHPYTRGLLDSAPRLHGRRSASALRGHAVDPSVVLSGCRFAARCPFRTDRCDAEEPPLIATNTVGARAACWVMPWAPAKATTASKAV
jgi:oligopeptide/dipeptide ABC transporter ATP-binding protein